MVKIDFKRMKVGLKRLRTRLGNIAGKIFTRKRVYSGIADAFIIASTITISAGFWEISKCYGLLSAGAGMAVLAVLYEYKARNVGKKAG